MVVTAFSAGRPPTVATVENIGEAIEFFDGLARSGSPLTVFRGHADIKWEVAPSIFRDDLNVLDFESRVVRDLVALYPTEFESDRTMFDRLVRMQHFGLRTRLMDVSRNPLAALYFSVEDGDHNHEDGCVVVFNIQDDRVKYYDSDSISCISNLANLTTAEKKIIEDTPARTIKELNDLQPVDRLYQFIRAEKPEFRPRIRREDLFKPYFVYPKMNNKRIIAQNGAFIVFGLDRTKGPKTSGISLTCVKIPALAKQTIRQSLQRLGYDDSTLFPDIERSARQIMKNYS
jgi:hypothetical protein